MTVAELIEKLKAMPQDKKVKVYNMDDGDSFPIIGITNGENGFNIVFIDCQNIIA